jgi:hypothetical protein
MEDGEVIRVEDFTGPKIGLPWWLDTRAILIAGKSGVICYGEITEDPEICSGVKIKQGQRIGTVKRVLPTDKGNGVSMLHVELYEPDYRGPTITTWDKDQETVPENLLDPTLYLIEAWSRVTNRFYRDAPPIPTSLEDRKKEISWVQSHPLWSNLVSLKKPPEGFTNPGGEPQIPDETWTTENELLGGGFHECTEFDFVYVDPTKERIVGDCYRDDPRNTDFRVWVEAGGWYDRSLDSNDWEPEGGWNSYNKWGRMHDIDLDCGGKTMEEALLNLATLVRFYYGEYDADTAWESDKMWERLPNVPEECEGHWNNLGEENEEYIDECEDAGDGFCKKCGYLIRCEAEED